MKSICTVIPASSENTEVHVPFIDLKVDVFLNHGVLQHFISLLALQTCWAMLKNNVRSALASSAFTILSHRSHNAHTTNHHLRGKGERNGVQWRTKVEP